MVEMRGLDVELGGWGGWGENTMDDNVLLIHY